MSERGERQKDTTDAYREGWEAVWGDADIVGIGEEARRKGLGKPAQELWPDGIRTHESVFSHLSERMSAEEFRRLYLNSPLLDEGDP